MSNKTMVTILAITIFATGGLFIMMKTQEASSQFARNPYRTGEPESLAALSAWYPEPPFGQNGAEYYQRAFALLPPTENNAALAALPVLGDAPEPELGASISESALTEISKFVESNRACVNAIHDAAEYRSSRFPLRFDLGEDMEYPHLSPLRDSARVLRLEMYHALGNGDTERAIESVTSSLSLANATKDEPIIFSQLVRIALSGIAFESLERLITLSELSDDQLEEFSHRLDEHEDTHSIYRGLVGERCLLLATDSIPATVKDEVLVLYEELIELSLRSYSERTVPDETRFATSSNEEVANFLPMLARTLDAGTRSEAHRRSAAVGIAVERYRVAHNELPQELSELVPEYLVAVSEDPFAPGNKLRYKQLTEGYVIYSVGQNRFDDGARDYTNSLETRDNGDITFAVLR